MSILDDVKTEVQSMNADAVREELQKLLTARAKRTELQKQRNADPEVKAKREAYSKQYREKAMADPVKKEKIIARRKAYMSKPEVKSRMKVYRDKRNARIKAVLARAKELGIEVPTPSTPAA